MRHLRCAVLALTVFALSVIAATASPLINFESLADSEVLTTQFSGVIFSNAVALTAGVSLNEFEFPPHSGTTVISDSAGPIRFTLAAPTNAVSFYLTYLTTVTITAFDSLGTIIFATKSAFTDNLALSGDLGSTPNELISASAATNIASVLIAGDPLGGSYALDDLLLTTATSTSPPTPPSTTTPTPTSMDEPASALLVMTWLVLGTLSWMGRSAFHAARPVIRVVAVGLVLCGLSGAARAQLASQPGLIPSAINAGTTSSVFVAARLTSPTLIPESVVVQLLDGQQNVVGSLGALNDSGRNGDVVADDGVYSGQVTVTAPATGQISLRVSYAERGVLRRSVTATAALDVMPPGFPTQATPVDLSQTGTDPATGQTIITNEVLACFDPALSPTTVQSIAAAVGGTLYGKFSGLAGCYQIVLARNSVADVTAAVAALRRRPEVVSAEPDAVQSLQLVNCTQPACGSIGWTNVGLAVAQVVATGRNVQIAIIDSGLDLRSTRVVARVFYAKDYTSFNPSSYQDVVIGHGTEVSSVIQAVAPDAILSMHKVCAIDPATGMGGCPIANEVAAISDAIAIKSKIINMSIAGPVPSSTLAMAVGRAQSNDVTVVAAAGNKTMSTPFYPAAIPGVVSVGAVSDTDVRANFSNYGASVSLAAPGVAVPVVGLNNASTADDGTSFSSPYVAGVAALVTERFPGLTYTQIRDQLMRSAVPITLATGSPNQDLGAGRLDAAAAMGALRITHTGLTSSVNALVSIDSGDGGSVTLGSNTAGCQIRLIPCSVDISLYKLKTLPSGSYSMLLRLSDPAANFSYRLRLAQPGLSFVAVSSPSNGTIVTPIDVQGSLIGSSINPSRSSVRFTIQKQ